MTPQNTGDSIIFRQVKAPLPCKKTQSR